MASMTAAASMTGAKLQVRAQVQTRRAAVACHASFDRRQAFAAAALAVAVALAPAAKADLVSDLLAKTEANKELHNKQRLAASNANFARSRTVTDQTCSFPANFLGCDIGEYAGDVKYIADEIKLQCQGTEPGLCAGNMNASKYTSR